MGQSQSTTPTTPNEWTPDQVKEATGLSKVSASDVKALNALSPSEKRELMASLHKQSKMTDATIKAIIKDAKAKAKKLPPLKKPPKELSDKSKAELSELPLDVAVVTQSKIEKVLAKKSKASKALVHREIIQVRTACGAWKASKKATPSAPKNPLSGRPLEKNKTTYKLVNTICKAKKKACATPTSSPLTGKPLKEGSKESKMLQELCLPKLAPKKKTKTTTPKKK